MERLHQTVTNANDRSDDDVTAGVVSAVSEIIGDFKQTILDCDVLLKDNSKFRRSPANFVDNVAWHTSTERVVNGLRKRLRVHMEKVSLTTKPLEIKLLSDIHRQQQQLTMEVAAIRAVLPPDPGRNNCPFNTHTQESSFQVPEELSERFREASAAKDPELSQVRDGLPLKEGFDALVYHFARSTENFKSSPGLGQEVPEEKYLNLIKSRWIIDRLKENAQFLSPEPNSLWAECITELEHKVRTEFVRFQQIGLLPPPLDALTRLPGNRFCIWVDEEPSPRPAALTEHRPSEEKILELPLQSVHSTHRSTLTVYRKSDTNLRLVSATIDDQNDNFLLQESMDVDMNQTGLVPVFAASHGTSTVNSNVLLCNQGQDTKSYNLREPADIAQFQRALTGFRVSHDMSNISWHIEFDQFSKSGESGKARLQLWQLKPLPTLQQPQDTDSAERCSSPGDRTPRSPVDSLNLRRFWTSGTTLPATSIACPVKGSRGAGIALTSPKPPVLIIFTMCSDRYAMIHLQCMLHGHSDVRVCSVLLMQS